MDTPDLSFEFVGAPDLVAVLEDYYRQTQKAGSAHCYLGVIVGCGSVVEGLLTWALLRKEKDALSSSKACKDEQGQVRPLREWNLSNLIDVSAEFGLIGKTAKQASWALKDFRNFIHPYNCRGLSQHSRLGSRWRLDRGRPHRVDRKVWQRGMREKVSLEEVPKYTADIKRYTRVFYEPPRWVPST